MLPILVENKFYLNATRGEIGTKGIEREASLRREERRRFDAVRGGGHTLPHNPSSQFPHNVSTVETSFQISISNTEEIMQWQPPVL